MLTTLAATAVAIAQAAAPATAASAPDGAALAAAMRRAMQSDGFELRLTLRDPADGSSTPQRIAIVGEFGAQRRRIALRGIAPANIANRRYRAELGADARVRLLEPALADVQAPVWGSALVPWDLLGAWWDWPVQELGGADQAAGHACRWLHSRPPAAAAGGGVTAVDSCIDAADGVALVTRCWGPRHRLLRSIEVTRLLRKSSGLAAAKSALIRAADGTTTAIEVYDGDEHHAIVADDFDAPTGARR
ncbi:MAG: hypothetical protein KGN16_04775 [Burkholderiales bacterium]|nr:hypothetical protein [Burkholderiales bacterium]